MQDTSQLISGTPAERNLEDPSVLHQLTGEYLADPAFRYQLKELIIWQQAELSQRARRGRFVDRVRNANMDDRFVKALLRLHAQKKVVYAGHEFVSEEFDELNQNGLVDIERGCTDKSGFMTRIVTLTHLGAELIAAKVEALPETGT